MGTIIGNWASGYNYLEAVKDTFTRTGTMLGSADTGTTWTNVYGGIGTDNGRAVPLLGTGVTGYRHSQLALLDPFMRWGSFEVSFQLDTTNDRFSGKHIRLVFWYLNEENQAYLEIGGRTSTSYYQGWSLNYIVNGTLTQDFLTNNPNNNSLNGVITKADLKMEIQKSGITISLTNVFRGTTFIARSDWGTGLRTIPTSALGLSGRYMGIAFAHTEPDGGVITGDTVQGNRWVDNLILSR